MTGQINAPSGMDGETPWTLWSNERPPHGVEIRLKNGAGKHGPNERYVRLTNSLCVIEPTGSRLVVMVRHDDLEWTLA
jgi:hypothetical protein